MAETAQELYELILATWSSLNNHYVITREVNNQAGFDHRRRLDAVVFNTWPSEGLRLMGFEIKVSAADFRRELEDTAKFQGFAAHLDTFSIVAPKGIVKKELLHDRWGLYCPDGKGGLRAVKKPLMLHDEGQRKTVNRSFIAAFCRAVVSRDVSQQECTKHYEAGVRSGEARWKSQAESRAGAHDRLKEAVKKFEEASGVMVNEYNAGQIGVAVNTVLKGGLTGMLERDGHKIHQVENLGQELMNIAERFRELTGVRPPLGDQ